jgi:succinoglycan biosynthesis protein ExoM
VVQICILTFRRPEGLGRLLDSLTGLTLEGEEAEVEILVVDNDPEQSALSVCQSRQQWLRWRLRYVVEPRRGIPQARNAAVRSVMGRADFLVFLDDDEVPDPIWMSELLRVQRTYGADVVTGPVFPHIQGPVSTYIVKGGFFEPPRHLTGARLDRAYTNNVLVRVTVFAQMPALFDERLSLAGGSDSHFFRRVARAGFKIIWAGDARVEEWVPRSRMTLRWILRRAYRTGNTAALCDRDLELSRYRRGVLLLRAVASATRALLMLPVSLLTGWHVAIEKMREICRGLGYMAGAVGARYEEYRQIHGS